MRNTAVLALVFALNLTTFLFFVKVEPQWERRKHDPVCINGNQDFEKWRTIISGRGTEEEPYVMENLSTESVIMNGIEVWNTSLYFIIRNVAIEGNESHAGIYLHNVRHVRIEGCEFKNNTFGIMIQNSSSLTIAGCRINSGTMGVFLNSSSSIIIMGCQVSNSSVGIYLKLSFNSVIDNCALSGNGNGMVLDSSSNNLITNCTIVENSLGILLYSSSNNTVFNNRFSNPVNWHIAGNSTGTKWNTTKTRGRNIIGGPCVGGNHWSDYKGVDEDKDGIGDTEIPYGPGDHLPLVKYGNTPPKADFFHYPLRITCMSETSFLDNSTDPDGRVVSWTWDFGDGCNATGMVATHMFTRKGNHTVRLTIRDDEGLEASCEKTITVYNSPPIANFTYSPKEPHANETVTFASSSIDPDGRIVSWKWFFGDGGEGLGENTIHIYAREGNYTVTLLVSDDEEETDGCLQTVSVNPVSKPLEENPGTQHPIWILIILITITTVTVVYVVFKKYFFTKQKGRREVVMKRITTPLACSTVHMLSLIEQVIATVSVLKPVQKKDDGARRLRTC